MEVVIQTSKKRAEELAAAIIAQQISEKPASTLGLATGRTMEPVYAELARHHKDDGLDFTKVCSFNLDEYIGLPPDHKESYRYYMNEMLFDHINIKAGNTHLPDGMADNIEEECHNYERKIHANGGIDIQLLGIGRSGHVGFNEPMSSLSSRTRIKTLTKSTFEQNGPLFDDPSEMPMHALTMGVATIMEARYCLMLITGSEKAEITAKFIEGPITSMVTASILQMHPKVTVILDEDAAANLTMKEYYSWVYDNKPGWQNLHD